MTFHIQSVAVIGGGTMGSSIAAACADAGRSVVIIESDERLAAKALDRTLASAQSSEEMAYLAQHIDAGTMESKHEKIAECDWICEAVVEDLETKRSVFAKLEPIRCNGSIVSSNTSGIMLKDIAAGFPQRLRRDILVTHFYNPVRVMRLLEMVAGPETRHEAVNGLSAFCHDVLRKGVVHAKDTPNFIGNRIGCYWMLSGLHKAKPDKAHGLGIEKIDALMGAPVGIPSTSLYGLIDLIGLDVMEFIGKNLAATLPAGDAGLAFTKFPEAEQVLLDRGQLGRKSGGGFYRVLKQAGGSKRKEVFDLESNEWRPAIPVQLAPHHAQASTLLFSDDPEGHYAWDLMGGTLLYAAGLLPEISEDLVSIDRAMRWGFAWKKGPFELLDEIGPQRVIDRVRSSGQPVPTMLAVLESAKAPSFYRDGEYLGLDGSYYSLPSE